MAGHWRLSREWIKEVKAKLEAGEVVRMSTGTRKRFLLGDHDQGLSLQWKSLGSGVWEARPEATDG